MDQCLHSGKFPLQSLDVLWLGQGHFEDWVQSWTSWLRYMYRESWKLVSQSVFLCLALKPERCSSPAFDQLWIGPWGPNYCRCLPSHCTTMLVCMVGDLNQSPKEREPDCWRAFLVSRRAIDRLWQPVHSSRDFNPISCWPMTWGSLSSLMIKLLESALWLPQIDTLAGVNIQTFVVRHHKSESRITALLWLKDELERRPMRKHML